jgi:hypothetical protein
MLAGGNCVASRELGTDGASAAQEHVAAGPVSVRLLEQNHVVT